MKKEGIQSRKRKPKSNSSSSSIGSSASNMNISMASNDPLSALGPNHPNNNLPVSASSKSNKHSKNSSSSSKKSKLMRNHFLTTEILFHLRL